MNSMHNQELDKSHLFLVLCQIARQLDSGVMIIDPQQRFEIVYANNVIVGMTGYTIDELLGKNLSLFYGPFTNDESTVALKQSLKFSMDYKMAIYSYRKNKSTFWNELSCLPVRNKVGEVQYYYVICRDVTNVINTESIVTLERDVYAAIEEGKTIEYILNKICDEVSLTLKKTCWCSIVLVEDNESSVVGTGKIPKQLAIHFDRYKINQWLHQNPVFPILNETYVAHNFNENLGELLEGTNVKTYWSYPIMSPDHDIIGNFSMTFSEDFEPDEHDMYYLERVVPIILLALHYIEQKKEIQNLAFYDPHTGLPNLTLFTKLIESSDMNGSIYIFEPSEFQNIIDAYSRDGGEELLKQLAERIGRLQTFKEAIVARYTSSTIIVALPTNNIGTTVLRRHLNDLTHEPYLVKNKQIYISLKIGTSQIKKGNELAIAIQQADSALSAALKNVGSIIYSYNPTLVETTQGKMNVMAQISKALQNDEFFPMLQPKVSIQTGEIESFEALARWISPELGFVSPAIFIAVAEDMGIVKRIDERLLCKVLHWQQDRLKAGKPLYQVSVNISPSYFYDPSFAENMAELIKTYGINPAYIKFEITESVELENVKRAKQIMNELKAYGIETSIDDFGVGYSSLSYLQELPFDEIKIDKSFVDNLHNTRVRAVVKTLIQLATDLQMKSVAEGIETEQQHEQLKILGCDYGQGYYYYRPLPLDEVNKVISKKH